MNTNRSSKKVSEPVSKKSKPYAQLTKLQKEAERKVAAKRIENKRAHKAAIAASMMASLSKYPTNPPTGEDLLERAKQLEGVRPAPKKGKFAKTQKATAADRKAAKRAARELAKAEKKEAREKARAEKAAAREAKKVERAALKAERKAKAAAKRQPKDVFVVSDGNLVLDRVVVDSQKPRVRQAVLRFLTAKGWDFEVNYQPEHDGGKLVLVNKMKQGNISKQHNTLNGFVAGYLMALAE